jgi:hypothetical protein
MKKNILCSLLGHKRRFIYNIFGKQIKAKCIRCKEVRYVFDPSEWFLIKEDENIKRLKTALNSHVYKKNLVPVTDNVLNVKIREIG